MNKDNKYEEELSKNRLLIDGSNLPVVEEVLGHLYAKPPIAEVTSQTSGINGSSAAKAKGASHPFPNSTQRNKSRVNSLNKTANALGTNEKLPSKLSDSTNTTELSSSSKSPSSSRKKVTENSHVEGHNKAGNRVIRHSRSGLGNKTTKKSAHYRLKEGGMDEDHQGGEESSSSSTSSTAAGGSITSGVSSTETSESEEDEEQKAAEERRQRQLAELKEKRKELRKKVKQLKHASLESSRQGKDGVSSPTKSSFSSSGKSSSALVPSPAHSYVTSLYSSGANCSGPIQDGDVAMPAPLDLCVKKPDFGFLTSTPLQQSPPAKFSERRRVRKAKSSLQDCSGVLLNSDQETESVANSSIASSDHSPLKIQNCSAGPASDADSVSSSKLVQSHSSFDHRRGRKRPWPSKTVDSKVQENKIGTSASGSSSESESSLDSGSDSDDTDDTEKSAAVSTASSAQTSVGVKRHSEEVADSTPKRKRILPEEKEIRIPVEHGWRRQTKIRCFSRSGVRGEVCYFSPCGKKLRNYSEVVRYLQRNTITDINRDNFSFSTKINVGDFLERVGGNGPEEYMLLSENEILARIKEVRARKGSLGVQYRRSTNQPKTNEEAEKQKKWEELQLQRRLEQQAEELRKQKEQQRQAKHQEKIDKQEQLRVEKEMRNQQLIEERERRRQHMMLVRALESRKKQEEREKKREEILNEKKIYKEKRMEQRRAELQLIREMKKPVDDMQLKETTPLPTLNRIPGLKIAGKAFGDILMLYEFLNNFGETLGFDMENLPSLSTLQLGLLNYDEKHEEELLSVVHHLIVCAVEDPGVPHCPQATNVLNQHLREVDITNNNVSEVLRLYVTALDRNSDMCRWLNEKPFLALNATQKASMIAFLCNELLYSKTVIRQIENSIDAVNALKRDKWVVEGQLRRLRAIHQRRCHPNKLGGAKEADEGESKMEEKPPGSDGVVPIKKGREDEEEAGNDSGNDSDETQETGHPSEAEDEEPEITNEELEKKIEKLNRQQHQFQSKLIKACGAVRTNSFGQDRFRRRYWVIPSTGGIFAEAMESSELAIIQDSIREEEEKNAKDEEEEEDAKETEITKDATNESQGEIIKAEEPTAPVKQEVKEEQNRTKNQDTVEIKPAKDVEVEQKLLTKEVIDSAESKVVKVIDSTESKKVDNVVDGADSKVVVVVSDAVESKPQVNAEKVEIALPIEDKKTNNEKPSPKVNKVDNKSIHPPEILSVVGSDVLRKPLLPEVKSEKSSSDNVKPAEKEKLVVVKSETPLLPKDIFPLGVPSVGKTPPSAGAQPGDKNWLVHSPLFASILAGSLFFNGPMMHGRELNGTYLDSMAKANASSSDSPFGPFLNFSSDASGSEQMMKSLVENQQPRHKSWFSVVPRMPCDSKSVVWVDGDKKGHTKICSPPAPASTLGVVDKPSKVHSSTGPTSCSSSSNAPSLKAGGSSGEGGGITAAALANLHMGLLNGIPPGILMHSFLAAHGMGQMYHQQGAPIPSPSSSSPSCLPGSATASTLPYSDAEQSLGLGPTEHPKKAMLDRMQYQKSKPIPKELRRGWWRITDVGQLKTLLAACHHRGIREKQLQKHLQKHFNHAVAACSQNNQSDVLDLEITDLDREVSRQVGGAPEPDGTDAWSPEVALRVDLAILEQVENLEDKVAGASMQMKEVPGLPHTSWRLPPRLSNDSSANFQAACVCDKQDAASEGRTIVNPQERDGSEDDDDEVEEDPNKIMNPVEVAKTRLLKVEAAIERRYVRPPLGTSTELNLNTITSSGTYGGGDDVTPGLLKWRKAVLKCTTSAQLAMCINSLEASIAWDKSIMRASCQFCHNGDNEEMLLLCDGCDKGYHTYCFKPKMETIPDGDWYCYECLNKATGDKVCVLCGKKGKMVSCETCPKTFHITCLDPPLSRVPKAKWYCSACSHKQPPKKSKAKSSNKEASSKEAKENAKKSETSKTKEKKEKNKSTGNKDITPCRTILSELESHQDAWPFLLPVNTKQFPTYRKIIKKAMDLHTVRSKLDGYKTREDFAADVRLVFDNCETFNEDDSPVGIAGHNMRAFFETRWAELCAT